MTSNKDPYQFAKVYASNIDGFPDRLKEVMGDESQRSFAQRIGVTEGTLRAWLSGKSEPGMQHLISLSEAGDTTIDWLAKGKGAMSNDQDDSSISVTVTANSEHPIRRKDINHGEPPEYAVKRAQTTTKEAPLDLQLLQEVIEALEAHLMIRGMMLTPARKALFIQLIYEHQMDTRLNKDETTEKFLKLLDE
jgi:transcriptional regulator with XRE-family HTH domain